MAKLAKSEVFGLWAIFVGALAIFISFAVMLTISYWLGLFLNMCGFVLIIQTYNRKIKERMDFEGLVSHLNKELDNAQTDNL